MIATNCDVRFDLNATTSTPYEGRTIMHCHILAHEDQGAMGWLDVQGGLAPPTFPDHTTAGSGGQGTSIAEVTVTVSTISLARGFKAGQAVVVVCDDQGNLVEGATVNGDFTGTFNESASGVTDATGSATLQTSGSAKGSVTVSFCTTSVTHATLSAYSGTACGSL